ncbi:MULTISPECIES: SUMF1/EgtB/PvdO family nonheme iron enzyme [Glycomyces]|uniref:Formylglycine-generating enzyme required for sulfatase activity n=2 Tax=Glycomyces TaxID=58113 RepID=A0A9X3PJ59_9ACTN|nr:SUMF1/EgtB/PvdO family nonheme iron enzyme [Glycomyces lechevalierae]MDA1383857.1 SUMF1/EgtB/PvdO family nonheme iron enzyme [Glycomyces lechevalierae]MDR7341152.1 formylglycine-generating enzyme required for sulfatase activity [Glycomyces lechevalierae]
MNTAADPDEAATDTFDPLVPRPIDRPTALPAGGRIDPAAGDVAKIFAAPDDPADWPAWREDLTAWRDEARRRLRYSGAAYEHPQTRWAASAYAVAQVWLWDERLFDHARQRFTVDAFLESIADQGGLDGLVLWHAYPIIGIDDRNQFDYYRDVPGLAKLVRDFHDRGLRVFVDYNPWDTGTRRTGRGDAEELAALVTEFGVDGVFLDTLKEGDANLTRALAEATPPQVLEGESRVPNQRVEDHLLSWAQWFADSEAPGVQRAHWYERRHMMHSIRRWNRDHSGELQSAWMNGTGILVWDAVFGVWVGWNRRDEATLRRMLRVQRAAHDLFTSAAWAPLDGAAAEAIEARVYVSRWNSGGTTLWTIVNRAEEEWTGDPLAAPLPEGGRRFDVTAGTVVASDGTVRVPGRGIAGVLELAPGAEEPVWLADLLKAAAADSGSDDAAFPAREAVRVVPAVSASRLAPGEAVRVAPGRRTVTVTFRRRETGFYQGAPYVEEWKPLPPRLHDDREETLPVDIRGPVAVAAREVTVNAYRIFLTATGYRPQTEHRFLCGTEEADDHAPVTGVSLADARAYASWVGARLPDEFEWQLASAQPGFERRTPAVWNWTESEHSDGVTRFAMLKGGSEHRSEGSDWYTDGGVRPPSFSLKYLLAGLGVERSAAIGFRIARDLDESDRDPLGDKA